METAAECYAMADQCEQQATTVKSPQARELLLEVATKWRKLGDEIKSSETDGKSRDQREKQQ